MKRKGPPYKIEPGLSGREPPVYVAAILKGRVVIDGSREQLRILGLNSEMEFRESVNPENNQELISLMLRLREKGLAFSYDYKAAMSPSDFMKSLQDKGILKSAFKEISWRGPKEWLLTTYDVE